MSRKKKAGYKANGHIQRMIERRNKRKFGDVEKPLRAEYDEAFDKLGRRRKGSTNEKDSDANKTESRQATA